MIPWLIDHTFGAVFGVSTNSWYETFASMYLAYVAVCVIFILACISMRASK